MTKTNKDSDRHTYWRCTNSSCTKGKVRAIRKTDWKRNHYCDFKDHSEFAYKGSEHIKIPRQDRGGKKVSGKHNIL